MAPGMAAGQLSDEELKALDERIMKPYFGEPLVDPERRAIYVLTAYNETNFLSIRRDATGDSNTTFSRATRSSSIGGERRPRSVTI